MTLRPPRSLAARVVRLARALTGADHASVWAGDAPGAEPLAHEGVAAAATIARVEMQMGAGRRIVVGWASARTPGEAERACIEDLAALLEASHAVELPEHPSGGLYRAAAGHLPNAAILMFDRELRYVLAEGPLLLASVGLTPLELVGRRAGSHADDPTVVEAMCTAALAGETRSLRMTRQESVFSVTTSPVRDARGAITHGLLFVYDDTERVGAEQAIRAEATRDPLTQLLNRAGFFGAVALALRHEQSSGLLVFADVDGLKDINDSLGHAAGDRAIVVAADALRAALRASDVVGRIGGDEFAAWVPEGLDEATLTQRIRSACTTLASTRGVPEVSLSIGVARCAHGDDPSERLGAADRAMYLDKRSRRATGVRARRHGAGGP